MPTIDKAQRTAARVAGASGLLGILVVVFGNYVLLDPLIVPNNATDTARNFLAQPTQARLALCCFLVYGALSIVLLSALYTVFRPVDRMLALMSAVFRLVFAVLWSLEALNLLQALKLLGGAPYLAAVPLTLLQAFARLNIGAGFEDYYTGLPFFGLAATVCAWLWFKSRYLPRGLAALGILASAWCVVCAFVFLVFPDFEKSVNAYWFDTPMALFELIVSIVLLVRGLPPEGRQQRPEPKG
jgi:hypothetical protein